MNVQMEAAILLVYGSMEETEEKDVDFFLELWKRCVSPEQQRDLIRSFRRQMICVAAGEAIASLEVA